MCKRVRGTEAATVTYVTGIDRQRMARPERFELPTPWFVEFRRAWHDLRAPTIFYSPFNELLRSSLTQLTLSHAMIRFARVTSG